MRAVEIARINLVRMSRDRMSLFFVFLLPVVLIVVLGVVYGGRTAPRLGVVSAGSGPLGDALVTAIRDGDMRLEMKTFAQDRQLVAAIESGSIEIGLRIPDGYDATIRSGGTPTVTISGREATALSALRQGVSAAVADQAARIRAARVAVARGVTEFDAGLSTAATAAALLPGVGVTVASVGEGIFPAGTGAFAPGAQSQLILFMFLTSMTAAVQIILSRQLGVSRRMVSTPTPIATIVVGELLGRFAIAMVQGVFIIVLSALAFGVAWGDPLAASLLVILFALVGTGAAMVVGVFSNNAEQAGALGVLAGMALGALGGAMVPLEIFGEPMRTLAKITPQAWAVQGLRAVGLRGAGVGDVLPELGVLALFAVVLIAVGTLRFRTILSR